jgi:nicotinamide mononucleotide transporter PnuC
MSVFALISWLRNPYQNNKAEVKVNTLKKAELFILWIPTVAVTVIFYFILKTFGTANLIPSTVSITTSFVAIYLSLRRSPYYALGYIANDIVLIVLWTLASIRDIHYISVTVCFVAFLFNDIYGFINWRRMQKRQSSHAASM